MLGALEKQRKATSFRMETNMVSEAGPVKMTVDYMRPDKMKQTVTVAINPKPVETILVGSKAWSKEDDAWTELSAEVTKEIERAIKEVKADPDRIQFWQFVLGKYTPTFVGQCEQAVKMAEDFVRDRLLDNMLSENPDKINVAEKIVKGLSDVDNNKSHDRHIHIDRCQELGLTIECLEDDQDLQEAVLTVHHCFMHSLAVSGAAKIVENHNGAAFIKLPS